MERSQKGGLRKCGDYVEVGFSGDDLYNTCVDKVINALDWEYGSLDGSPYLCRLSGSRILDKPIDNNVPWTIRGYVESVFASMSHVKIGVALFEVCQYYYLLHATFFNVWAFSI